MKNYYSIGIIILCFYAFNSLEASAQDAWIQNFQIVSAKDGLVIPGVSLSIGSEKTSYLSDNLGKVSLELNESPNLIRISHIGYTTKIIGINELSERSDE